MIQELIEKRLLKHKTPNASKKESSFLQPFWLNIKTFTIFLLYFEALVLLALDWNFFFERHYEDKTYSHYYFDKKSHTLASNWKKDHHTLLALTCQAVTSVLKQKDHHTLLALTCHAVTSVLKQKDHHTLLTLTCHAVPSVLKLSMSSSIQFFSRGEFVKQ